MARYTMTARRFEGSLAAPIRNETRTAEGDERAPLDDLAAGLVAQGFTVWISERRDRGHAQVTYHVLAEWHPTTPSGGGVTP